MTYDDADSGGSDQEEEINEPEDPNADTYKPNLQFKSYAALFNNLTKEKKVATMWPIITCMISYDSTRAITVTKKDDREFWIRMYNLETYEKTFNEQVGGQPNSFIRCKEVEQNYQGNKYAFVYIDDGKFRLRVMGKEERSPETVQKEEFDINKALGINDYTMPIQGFADPFCTCSFITDDRIFVQLFYNYELIHYHFIYDHSTRKIEG